MGKPITRFKELSWPVKVAVIAGWIYIVEFMLHFSYGFITTFYGI